MYASSVSDITLDHLLEAYPSEAQPNEDALSFLLRVFHDDIYPSPSIGVWASIYTFCAIFGLCLVGSAVILVARFRRGNVALYRLNRSPYGTYIAPNVINNFCIYNIIFVALVYPYIFIDAYRLVDDVRDTPIWMCLVFLALFLALWHAVWGTAVAANISRQTVRGWEKETAVIPAYLMNVFFCTGFFACVVSMIVATSIIQLDWNDGITAYLDFKSEAEAAVAAGAAPTTVAEVTSALPDAARLIRSMAANLWDFANPWQVCAAWAALTGCTMAFACFWQVTALQQQIIRMRLSSQLRMPPSLAVPQTWQPSEATAAEPSEVTSQGSGLTQPTSNSTQGSRGEHSTSVLIKPALRERRDIKTKKSLECMLRNVIWLSMALCAASFGYFAVCFIGNQGLASTPLFHIVNSNKAHSSIFLYLYAILDVIVICCMLLQTFNDHAVVRTASNRALFRMLRSRSFSSDEDPKFASQTLEVTLEDGETASRGKEEIATPVLATPRPMPSSTSPTTPAPPYSPHGPPRYPTTATGSSVRFQDAVSPIVEAQDEPRT